MLNMLESADQIANQAFQLDLSIHEQEKDKHLKFKSDEGLSYFFKHL